VNKALKEGTKTTGRVTVIGAIGILVTYLLSLVLPDLPQEVVAAIIVLVGVGLDSFAHHSGSKLKVPF